MSPGIPYQLSNLVVIGRFDKHKYKNWLRTKLYDKTADLDFPIGTLHLLRNA
jgi:hypothetical protein